jgi:hypothetical protein
MPDPFEAVSNASGEVRSLARTASRRMGSDARIERRDAVHEGRRAPPIPRDALPAPPDAPPVPRDGPPIPGDAPRIRSDTARRRRRKSRRVTQSSRTSRGARPVSRERERVPRVLFGARDDALRIRRLRRRGAERRVRAVRAPVRPSIHPRLRRRRHRSERRPAGLLGPIRSLGRVAVHTE